jgi:hypothetical protein
MTMTSIFSIGGRPWAISLMAISLSARGAGPSAGQQQRVALGHPLPPSPGVAV